MPFQKFRRGDLVMCQHSDVTPNLPPLGIVLGSYADQFGGSDTKSYTVMFQRHGRVSWYQESQLREAGHVGEDGIAKMQAELDAEQAQESDLDWAQANYPGLDAGLPFSGHACDALMAAVGITNGWGVRGEGATLHEARMVTLNLLDEALLTRDRATLDARIAEVKAMPELHEFIRRYGLDQPCRVSGPHS